MKRRLTERKSLTDRYLKSLKPAPRGERVEVYDPNPSIPGFGIRVSDIEDANPARRGKAGRITFILRSRFSAGTAPTRRVIGIYGIGGITLEEARNTAGKWRSLIARGVDPAVIEAERHQAEARERALRIKHSFTNVAEAFIADKLSQERSGNDSERTLRKVFVAAWAAKPISEITAHDVLEIINTKKRTAPKMAGALLVLIRRFFTWAIDQQIYGLSASPCDRLSVVRLVGPMSSRDRRLTDAEIFAFWQATGEMEYPAGPLYRMLLLTGLRLNECAQLSWSEVQGDTIVIPAARMKGREGKAREHLVPLSNAVKEVIASLPNYGSRSYLFSFNAGKSPLRMTGLIKADLDRRMLLTLRAMSRHHGDDHEVTLPNWTNHDLRRVVRSGLSALRIAHDVAEAILAHRKGGIVGTYNLHEYEDEKREALEKWAGRIASIVNPKPAKVIKLPRQRR